MAAPIALVFINLLLMSATAWVYVTLLPRSGWAAVLVGVALCATAGVLVSRSRLVAAFTRLNPVVGAVVCGFSWAAVTALVLFIQNSGNAKGLAIAVPLLGSAQFVFGATFFLGARLPAKIRPG